MKIIYKKGDLVNCEERYILHGCNAQGVMGSGVAKAIRDKWEHVFTEYKEYIDMTMGTYNMDALLGSIHTVYVKPSPSLMHDYSWQMVINAISQEYYGRDGKQYVSYDAIRKIMKSVEKTFPGKNIAMSKIGSSLGGGDWKIISNIIEEESKTFQPIVYELI